VLSTKAMDEDREPARTEDTLRTCALTRAERPVSELVRFVAGPDGNLVPDLARRLPGRGVWVTASAAVVADAARSKAFARSLKRAVAVPAELADVVARLMERRAGESLALANKAGQVVAGFAKVEAAVGGGHAIALMHAAEAADDGRNKLDQKQRHVSQDLGRPTIILSCLTIEQMSLALGRANVVHAALLEGGAARRAVIEAERLERYRSRSWPSAVPASQDPPDV